MGIGQHTSVTDDDCLLDGMLQLADVAIPRMLLQLLLGLFGEGERALVVLLAEALDEKLGQGDDVFLAFT